MKNHNELAIELGKLGQRGQEVLDEIMKHFHRYREVAQHLGMQNSSISRLLNYAECTPRLFIRLSNLLTELEGEDGYNCKDGEEVELENRRQHLSS